MELFENALTFLWIFKWHIVAVSLFIGLALMAERHGPIDEDQIR